MSGADERVIHPEGKDFMTFWYMLLGDRGRNCFERDVLRDSKEVLWENWKRRAKQINENSK